MRLGRRPFADLVRRQLDLLASDEAALLEEARTAELAWQRAGRECAEEAYGDWQLVADAIAERLLDLRETYAATLDGDGPNAYRRSFGKAVSKRLPRFGGLLDE